MSKHEKYKNPETKAAKWNSAIVHFNVYTCNNKKQLPSRDWPLDVGRVFLPSRHREFDAWPCSCVHHSAGWWRQQLPVVLWRHRRAPARAWTWIPSLGSAQPGSEPPQNSPRLFKNMFRTRDSTANMQKFQIWMPRHLTSPWLCVGNIDEPIHCLAHLLDLRGGAVDGATWLICSINGKKFITDALLLQSGSFPLCPANKYSFCDR